jgi:hypothetical protein
MQKKLKELHEAAVELNLRRSQYNNIKKIADSPLPKHKTKKFEKLVLEYYIRLRNASERFENLERKYGKFLETA